MHPLEHLRHVARVDGADPALVAREAASSLAEVARSTGVAGGVVGASGAAGAGLLPACRRLLDHHPSNGPLWWLCARVLAAFDPADEAREAGAALAHDQTSLRVADAVPEESSVLVVGWPDTVAYALRRRGDLEVLLLDSGGDGAALARRLESAGNEVALVPDRGVAPAATVAGVVLLEAHAAGPGGLLAAPGSHAAAAVASRSGVPVWAVCGVGRVLPAALWEAALGRLDASGLEPWERDVELVPAGLLDSVIGPTGSVPAEEGLAATTAPACPELLRPTA